MGASVMPAPLESLVVAADVEMVVAVDEVVAGSPLLVETMAPNPLRTMPRFCAQHGGSLSQQKLPSLHSTTRGIRPVSVSERKQSAKDGPSL